MWRQQAHIRVDRLIIEVYAGCQVQVYTFGLIARVSVFECGLCVFDRHTNTPRKKEFAFDRVRRIVPNQKLYATI